MLISEVSTKYGLSPDTLRYYERAGLLPQVPRRANGIRDYDESSCKWIEFVQCMRRAGMSVEALAEYIKLYQSGAATKEARISVLKSELQRMDSQIAELASIRERLAWKVNNFYAVNE